MAKINSDKTKFDIFMHRLITYIGMALLKYVLSMIITSQMMKTDVRATLSNSAWNNIAIAWIAEIQLGRYLGPLLWPHFN